MDGMYESAKQFGFDDWYPKLDEYLNGFIQDKESPGYYMARNQTQPYGSCIMPAVCSRRRILGCARWSRDFRHWSHVESGISF